MSLATKTISSSSPIQFCSTSTTTSKNDIQNSSTNTSTTSLTLSPVDFASYKAYQNPNVHISSGDFSPANFMFSSTPDNTSPSMLINMYSVLGDHNRYGSKSSPQDHGIDDLVSGVSQDQCNNNVNGISMALPYELLQGNILGNISSCISTTTDHQYSMIKNHDDHDQDQTWEAVRSLGFNPFSSLPTLPPLNTAMGDPWKPSLLWDSSSPCPTEMSTNFPTSTKCYT